MEVQQAMLLGAAGYATGAAGYATGAAGYNTFCQINIPLRGPSCKLRLSRFSAKLKFQDGPSVAICGLQYNYD